MSCAFDNSSPSPTPAARRNPGQVLQPLQVDALQHGTGARVVSSPVAQSGFDLDPAHRFARADRNHIRQKHELAPRIQARRPHRRSDPAGGDILPQFKHHLMKLTEILEMPVERSFRRPDLTRQGLHPDRADPAPGQGAERGWSFP